MSNPNANRYQPIICWIIDGRIDSDLFFDGVAQTIKIHTGIACMQDLRWQ